MRPELRSLILDYQARVAQACRLIRERLGLTIDNPFQCVEPSVPRRGWLDDAQTISYMFHGIGCRVMFGKVEVDFDFGPGGRFDGFDAWRLSLFAKTVRKYSAFADDGRLRPELNTLLAAGELIDFPDEPGSQLLYLPDSPTETPRPPC